MFAALGRSSGELRYSAPSAVVQILRALRVLRSHPCIASRPSRRRGEKSPCFRRKTPLIRVPRWAGGNFFTGSNGHFCGNLQPIPPEWVRVAGRVSGVIQDLPGVGPAGRHCGGLRKQPDPRPRKEPSPADQHPSLGPGRDDRREQSRHCQSASFGHKPGERLADESAKSVECSFIIGVCRSAARTEGSWLSLERENNELH